MLHYEGLHFSAICNLGLETVFCDVKWTCSGLNRLTMAVTLRKEASAHITQEVFTVSEPYRPGMYAEPWLKDLIPIKKNISLQQVFFIHLC